MRIRRIENVLSYRRQVSFKSKRQKKEIFTIGQWYTTFFKEMTQSSDYAKTRSNISISKELVKVD